MQSTQQLCKRTWMRSGKPSPLEVVGKGVQLQLLAM
jgi:hypothetical protein